MQDLTLSNPRRKDLIKKIVDDDLPFNEVMLKREESARRYARSLLSFNCSLNGDLNMRIWEILSAGDCLVTDRLSVQSGLNTVLNEGEHYVGYDNYAELKQKVEALLENPADAIRIAQTGHEAYLRTTTPSHLAANFLKWCLAPSGSYPSFDYTEQIEPVDGVEANRRLEIFEYLQRQQMFRERTQTLAVGASAAGIAADQAALPRVRTRIMELPGIKSEHPGATVPRETLRGSKWPVVIADESCLQILETDNISADKLFVL